MSMSISVRARLIKLVAQIEVTIVHPTQDGHQLDPKSGKVIPANFVQQLRIRAQDQLLAECEFGGGLSDNPSVLFKARGLKPGTEISVLWTDSKAATGTATTLLSADA